MSATVKFPTEFLLRMMFEKADAEFRSGDPDEAIALVHTVLRRYPENAEARKRLERYEASIHSPGERSINESQLAIALSREFTPEFEFAADILLARYAQGGAIGGGGLSAGLGFGAGSFPPELVKLFEACIPIVEFVAKAGVEAFLPVDRRGRTESALHEAIMDNIAAEEARNADFKAAIEALERSYRKARRQGETADVRAMLARSLALAESIEVMEDDGDS